MLGYTVALSFVSTVLLLAGFYLVLHFTTAYRNLYRLFVIVFLSAWSTVLWSRPHRPTAALLVVSAVFLAALWGLAFIKRRPPANRRETKMLLEHIQGERRVEKFFASFGDRVFWSLLAFLVLSLCYRLLSFYDAGMV